MLCRRLLDNWTHNYNTTSNKNKNTIALNSQNTTLRRAAYMWINIFKLRSSLADNQKHAIGLVSIEKSIANVSNKPTKS